jgi:hypothetical protein
MTYFCQKFGSPMVILSRKENTANTLERNRAPKIGDGKGRWCSRTEKIELKCLFMERFFFPVEQKIEYVFNREQLLHILDQQKISYPSKLKSSKKEKLIAFVKEKYRMGEIISNYKSQYLTQDDEYQLSEFNKVILDWELQEATTSRVTLYDKVRNDANRIEDYQEFGVKSINNVVEFVGITKHQSPNRALQNPNVKVSNISSGKKQFWTFEYYPIFHLSYQASKELVDPLPLKQNPFERIYREFVNGENKEVRFGCALCPYKSENFYKKSREDHAEIYYYARFLASAKNLITEDREYHYFQSSEII